MPYGSIKVDNIVFTNGGVDQTVTVSGIVQSISGNITATGTIQGATIIGTSTVSGATVTGNVGAFTAVTGQTAGFTTITGTTVTGTTANFATISGATITGGHVTTASGTYTGSVTAASFIPTSSTAPTNGLYLSATNTVGISTNGTGKLFVDASGNVTIDTNTLYVDATNNRIGIGTTSPNYGIDYQTTSTSLTSNLKVNAAAGIGNYAEIAFQLWSGAGSGANTFGGSGTSRPGVVLRAIDTSGAASGDFVVATFSGGATNANLTEKFRITSTGNVGIGTSSPGARLHVRTPNTNAGQITAECETYNTNDIIGLDFRVAGGSLQAFTRATVTNGTTAATALTFGTASGGNNATEVGRFDSAGRLLVGTTTARAVASSVIFPVLVESANYAGFAAVTNRNDADGCYVMLGKSRGTTVGSSTIVQNNDLLGGFLFGGADGTDLESRAGSIICEVDGVPGLNDMPGRLVFSTTLDGAAIPTARMTIKNDGKIGIGTTVPGYTLDVAGTVNANATYRASNGTHIGIFGSEVFAAGVVGVGSTSNHPLVLGTNSSEKVRILANGNVGIGTTSPQGLLDISTASSGGAQTPLVLGTAASGISGSQSIYLGAYGSTLYGAKIKSIYNYAAAVSAQLAFETANSSGTLIEAIRIDASQRVGIGTTSPGAALQIVSSTSADQMRIGANTTDYYKIGRDTSLGKLTFEGVQQSFSGYDFKIYPTSGSAGTSALVIKEGTGNVGIGTTSPSTKFEVIDINTIIKSSSTSGYAAFYANAATGSAAYYFFAINGTEHARISATNNDLIFGNGSAGLEKARIDSSGRLLVGTSSARSVGGSIVSPQLQIESPNSSIAGFSVITNRGDAIGPSIYLGKSRGAANGGITIVANNDTLGDIRFAGADGIDIETLGALISCEVDGTPGANDMPGRLVFSTTADGAASPAPRMTIDSSGRLLIGTSSTIYNSRFTAYTSANENLGSLISAYTGGDAANWGLYIAKYSNDSTTSQKFIGFAINNNTAGNGQINANGASQAAFGTFSDIRLKENVAVLEPQLDNLMQLRPVEFDYKDGSGHQTGFIAQELQQVYPDVVTEQDGYLVVTGYGKNEARLIKALQEAVERIETLEAKVAALEAA